MKRVLSLILAPLFICLLLASAVSGDELEESRRSLEAIRARIARAAGDLEARQAAANSLNDDLKTVEQAMGRLRRRIASLGREVAALAEEAAAKEEERAAASAATAVLKEKVRQRLAALYKGGEMGLLRVLFSTASPARRAEEYDFLGRVVRRDRELLEDYRRQTAELETALAQLAELQRRREAALASERANRTTLKEAQALKKSLLAQAQRDEAQLAALLKELQRRAESLATLVKRLESEQAREYTEKTGLFAGEKGRLPWPAGGAVRVAFGPGRHPELGTEYDSQGLEIAAATATPIRAVWPGRVIFANPFQGYGNLVIVDHGDSYYTLYAQAARLDKQVGDTVAAGEVLAMSGFEGRDTFYFEVRHRGTPLDPAAWLAPR